MAEILKNTIGLGIRDNSLTAVELAKKKNDFDVVNYSHLSLDPGIVDENSILINPEAFKLAVKKLLKEGREGEIKSSNVIISIPEEKTFSHYLEIPAEDANDHEAILKYAKSIIPIELSEAVMDYKRLKRAAGKKEVAFDFVATQRSIVNPLIDTLQSIGLTVVAVDVDKNSLMRVCQHCTKSKKSSMLIEIDDERSMLSVKGDCGTSHTLSLSLGEKPLIEKIQQELDIESAAKAKSILQEAENEPNPKSEEVIAAQVLLNEFYETVLQKARELQQQNQQEGCSDIETLFIVELGRKWAGLKEVLKKNFPKAKLLEQFENHFYHSSFLNTLDYQGIFESAPFPHQLN